MTLDDIQHLVALQLGRLAVRPDDRFYEDLGAESMDLVNLAVAIEDRCRVFIAEEDLADAHTVRDLYRLVHRHLGAPS
jgi:acyl carrier protein